MIDLKKKRFTNLTRTKTSSNAQIEPKLEKSVHFSPKFKAPNLKLSQDMLSVTGHKGYRSVLSNYPIIEGTYFFEAKFEKSSQPAPFVGIEPQVRIGISTLKLDSEISLGSDRFSYAYKSADGCTVYDGIKKVYGEKYEEGDVIGCLIHMKPPKPKVKGDGLEKQKIEINEGSRLLFYKNGKCIGIAFADMIEGFYHAGVSVYMNSKVRVNFGPDFEYPPNLEELDEQLQDCKPYSVIANEPKPYEDIEFP